MSGKSDPSEAPAGDDADAEAGFESWLRAAARSETQLVPLPRPGQVIGNKYRIEEQLGKGGMGAVFRATHVVSDKAVALKWMLRPSSDDQAKERFTREARAAGRIDHPNVVDVYDIGEDGNAAFLVMELLRGESLRARLARGPLAQTEIIDLLLPAMRGVAAAHREGVIHRDLKPDNIFLCRSPDGSEREAKVLDFGISAITVRDEGLATLTQDGAILGTPAYMSPEQLASARDLDLRTDIYAFGVILYEALTGSLPFQNSNYSALVLAIANTQPQPPRALRPEIPVALERVVLHALERERDKRLPSMDALIAALSPFASIPSSGSGEHSAASGRPLFSPFSPFAQTARIRTLASVAALALLASVAWWWMQGNARPATAEPPPHVIAKPAQQGPAGPTEQPMHAVPTTAEPVRPIAPVAPVAPPAPVPSTPSQPSVAERTGAPLQRAATPRPRTDSPVPSPTATKPEGARGGAITLDEL